MYGRGSVCIIQLRHSFDADAEQERRAAIRDSWAKHAEASKDMIIRFYVHEECSDDEELHHHDVVCTRDLDFQDPLDRDQEGVTQRVQMELLITTQTTVLLSSKHYRRNALLWTICKLLVLQQLITDY